MYDTCRRNFYISNIGLIDVGAGTSDICLTKDGSIIAYGMIPLAGDEITEVIAKNYLVDFNTAEKIKMAASSDINEPVVFKDIMGLEQTISVDEILKIADDSVDTMAKNTADKIIELNGGKPVNAVFVVGGGGKITGYTDKIADYLGIARQRVAVRGPDQMSENTKVIHIDIDPAEIGKNVKTEIPIVGDMKNVINMLLDSIGDYKVTTMWSETVKNWKKDLYREPPVFDGFVEPRTLVGHLSAMFRSKAILVADVGQNQIWCANNFRIREGRFLTTGGMGTMGYSIPAAIGAKFARPDRDVIVICGDGSFQMGLNELATIAGNQLGIKIIIMKNARLGMVRELQDKHYGGRHSATILNGDPDFLKIADAYGIDHAEAHSNKEAENIIKGIVDSEKPFILVCDVHPDTPSI